MNALPVKRILVPTDFSDCSRAAFAPARELGERMGAELILLNVIDRTHGHDFAYGVSDDALRGLRHERLEGLERIAGEAFPGLRVRWIVTIGGAPEKIVAHARREKADLVVLSTHGWTGLRRWLLGSVAERVVRTSPCPVLTVKPRPELPDRPPPREPALLVPHP